MLSAEFSPQNRKWTYSDALLWIGKTLKKYHAPTKMREELEEVRQALNELPRTGDTFGLVHYDFEPALDALLENIPADKQLNAKKAFLQGYQSIKTLESDYTEKLELMRRFCNLYSYARLIRCVAEEYSNEPDWMVTLREKLHRKIELLESAVVR